MKQFLIAFLFILSFVTAHAQSLENCSNCSQKAVTTEQIKDKSLDEIRVLTNEIYARKGYVFKEARFQEYFESKSWYKAVKTNADVQLNGIEKQNVEFFQKRRKQLEDQRKQVLELLKTFKKSVLLNDSHSLTNQFGYTSENPSDIDYLKKVLNEIDVNAIDWYKNKGLHKVLVDNGFAIIEYSVRIETNKIDFVYNFMTHSEIIEDFGVYTDYHSENEGMFNWQFEFVNGKLHFIQLVVAG